jgi:DivIVA domain-containing protein
LAQWATTQTFPITLLRPGYQPAEVDDFVEAVRDTFLGVRQPPLTASEVRDKIFPTTRPRPGYDQEEVDAFLGEA